jgi:hypothetical protein
MFGIFNRKKAPADARQELAPALMQGVPNYPPGMLQAIARHDYLSSPTAMRKAVAPDGWSKMDTAPRDGTVIEIKNCYGLLPTYGLHRWDGSSWRDASDPVRGLGSAEASFFWRPHTGDVASYVDHNPSDADWQRIVRPY